MGKMVNCHCGDTLRGKDEEELMANCMQHAKEKHPDEEMTDEKIAEMKAQIKDEE